MLKYTDNELLSELLKRGNVPLYPASEDDELKIEYFKAFWQHLSPTEIFYALSSQFVRVSNLKKDEVDLPTLSKINS